MLQKIFIQDFAIISENTIQFGPGFTAITGETGAGKSILLHAIRLICGEKANASMIRLNAEKAVIEATFNITHNTKAKNILDRLEIDIEDELIIRRELLKSGKSRARVNDAVVNLVALQELSETLIQMHGQSEQVLLRDIRTHEQMLDDYCMNHELLENYKTLYNEWSQKKQAAENLKKRATELAIQKDFLKFQFQELSNAKLKLGEEESLEELTSSASKGEVERRFLEDISRILESENGLLDQLRSFSSKLKQLANRLPQYEINFQTYEALQEPLESFFKDFESIKPDTEISPRELESANTRLAFLQQLKRKYKTDIASLINLKSTREKELSSIENLDSDMKEFQKQISELENQLLVLAKELSTKRHDKAKILDLAVETILHELGMPGARFKTEIQNTPLHSTGIDQVEFLMAPNIGEGEKSLKRAVSGGELSRVLLAFKTVLAELDTTPLLIFDEVDSGISGEVGNKIGEALQKLGKHHQILSITHLHQVASLAQNQLAVKKEEIENRTYSKIFNLDYQGRLLELSRMLGDEHSQTVQEHVKQLLEAAQ